MWHIPFDADIEEGGDCDDCDMHAAGLDVTGHFLDMSDDRRPSTGRGTEDTSTALDTALLYNRE
jgi:hypothetical protein